MAAEFRSIEDAVRGIKESTYEVQTESRLAYSGLKREQNIAGVLEKYAWLYNLETVRRAEEAYHTETDTENKERLRRVYYYLLEGYIGQQTAPLEDELVSFEAGATVEVDGESIPYHNVPVLIASEHDFERRNRLREATLAVVEESNPKRMEILRARLAALAGEFGHGSYTAYNAEKSGSTTGSCARAWRAFSRRQRRPTRRSWAGGWSRQRAGGLERSAATTSPT